jgi:hypothetical protein
MKCRTLAAQHLRWGLVPYLKAGRDRSVRPSASEVEAGSRHWRRFANEIANEPGGTTRHAVIQANILGAKKANQSTRLVTGWHAPA